ncbi:MAG: aminomethyltransferase family protein [Pseudomonadota bacterium]|nr:aminomethyltransferase family protein [Pseudomonadota bacterium]
MGNFQEITDLNNTVMISGRRFEESPFIERFNSEKMVRGIYAGRFFPVSIGEDRIETYWKLRQKALLFDVPEKPIEISGPDSVKFLNEIFVRDVTRMNVGRGYYAIACNYDGGIIMDGVLFKLDDNKFWYVQADGPFETWLSAHSGTYNVQISDPKSRVLQIQGPASIDIMKAASNNVIDETFKYFCSGFYDIGDQCLYVSRTGFTNELGFEIYCNKDTDHLALWDFLVEVGNKYGMEFSSTKAMTMRRIEGGILGNLTDMTSDMTPFDAGIGGFVDLGKHSFIGKEALIEREKRCRLFGLTCKTKIPSSGSSISYNDKAVGYVTAGVPSPTLDLGIGYVVFNTHDDWLGLKVQLNHPDGTKHEAEVVDIPFFDPARLIVRGIDKEIPAQTKLKNLKKLI